MADTPTLPPEQDSEALPDEAEPDPREKARLMEQAQEEAAEERESNRGYQ